MPPLAKGWLPFVSRKAGESRGMLGFTRSNAARVIKDSRRMLGAFACAEL